jgi:hypothetical protein
MLIGNFANTLLPTGADNLAGFWFENEKKIKKVLEYEIYGE